MKKSLIAVIIVLSLIVVSFSGCTEPKVINGELTDVSYQIKGGVGDTESCYITIDNNSLIIDISRLYISNKGNIYDEYLMYKYLKPLIGEDVKVTYLRNIDGKYLIEVEVIK
jgi:hypothetical protein